MNPTVPQADIDRVYNRDPDTAEAEYGAQFPRNVVAFIAREVVEAAGRGATNSAAGRCRHLCGPERKAIAAMSK
jgi:hypothetical protein